MSRGSVEPIHAYGFFTVSENLEFNQIAVFEYLDYDRYYAGVSKNIERLNKELSELAYNMQAYLDGEEVVVNGERVRPLVIGASLGFKGNPEEPYLVFFIYFRGKPRKGVNYYENVYEAEVSEYPYEAYWVFPPNSKVSEVECSGVSEIIGDRIVVMRVDEGERVTGYEKIIFHLR